jgi:hypothetical protein
MVGADLYRWRSIVAIAVLAGSLVGCGGGNNNKGSSGSATAVTLSIGSETGTAPPSQHELAQTYLRIVRPGNAAVDSFKAKAARWNHNTTGVQAAKDAAPLIAAIQKADRQMLRVEWPPSTTADVKDLVRAHGALVGDLNALETLNILSAGDWVNQFTQDAGKAAAGANIVRADLGLSSSKP